MGRNILSICDECEVYIFHLRGKESDLMQKFQNEHSDHEKSTRIISDYVEEQPESYEDVTDAMTPSTSLPEQDSVNEKLQTLHRRGWSHDELAWLIEVSRPTIRKILDGNGEDILGELETAVIDATLSSFLTQKKFVEYAKNSYRLELLRRHL